LKIRSCAPSFFIIRIFSKTLLEIKMIHGIGISV
jgi:hypothetical protein